MESFFFSLSVLGGGVRERFCWSLAAQQRKSTTTIQKRCGWMTKDQQSFKMVLRAGSWGSCSHGIWHWMNPRCLRALPHSRGSYRHALGRCYRTLRWCRAHLGLDVSSLWTHLEQNWEARLLQEEPISRQWKLLWEMNASIWWMRTAMGMASQLSCCSLSPRQAEHSLCWQNINYAREQEWLAFRFR